ncbi:BTAD domain-containing putative transcriptional regulator [Kribbella sp. C-35]|uniref:AfsR/SARP family transcriptional regulator n=1 Tax=Kribbella sp. C-35 TaxID=2789276 RepID=UPI0039784423
MSHPLYIELLGPLRIRWHGTELPIRAQRLQALLAVLALRANQICTASELLDAVWQDNPPGTGVKVLPPYIYRLRRTLPEDILTHTSDGYLLRLDEDALDVTEFENAVRRATELRERGELDAAAAEYRTALALHRGEPLAGLPGQFLAAQRLRLAERRDKVFGERVDVDLERGRAAELVAELVPAVAARPFDERLAGQLMQALSADGRQADALDVYSRTRQTLIDELGVEPGPALREVHQTILRNETTAQVRDELPYAGATFVGRDAELGHLADVLSATDSQAPPIVAIDGMAGVGKTALAVNTARKLARRYPDGLLFVDLHGHTPGRPPLDVKAALDHLLLGADVPAAAIPHTLEKAQALWRTTVEGRRVLVVLDNALDSTTVNQLLPGSPTCGVLITSRTQLTGLDVRDRLHLGLLDSTDATDLLAALVGAERATADVAASNDLIERCGNLPLALRIAGARLRHRPAWTVAHINQRLDRVGRRLTELTADGLGIAAAFQLSYDQLAPKQQRMFRLLSALPGRDFDRYGAAALVDCAPEEAADLAESLVDANLLLEPTPDRYQFHDLIRDYAAELARTTDVDPDVATDRLLEYYVQTANHPLAQQGNAPFLELGDRPLVVELPALDTIRQAVTWADAEAVNLAAAVEQALARGRLEYTWLVALGSMRLLQLRGYRQQEKQVIELGLEAARRAGNRQAEAHMLHALSSYLRGRGNTQGATDALREALELLPDDADPRVRGRLYTSLGLAMQTVDPFGEALPALRKAADIAREVQDDLLLGRALTFSGLALSNACEYVDAEQSYTAALAILRPRGASGLRADALSGLTTCYVNLGRLDEAMASATEARDVAVELESSFSIPFALARLALVNRLQGNVDTALAQSREAVAVAEHGGNEQVRWSARQSLGTTLLAAGETDEALECFEYVHRGAVADQNNAYIVGALEGLSDHAAAVGDPAKAAAYLEEALTISDEVSPARSVGLRTKLTNL